MFLLKKIYAIWFVLFLGSCFQTANFPVEFTIFKSEISNYKQIIALNKSPFVTYHVAMKNKTNKQLLLNNLNTAIVKSKNGILLEELNIVPKNIMLKPYAKDTFVIVKQLLIGDLTEKKVNSFVEDVKKITISLDNEFNEEKLEIVLFNDYKFYVK